MEVSILPALFELFKLSVFMLGVLSLGLGFAWVNFRIWMVPFYLSLMSLFGLSLGFFVYFSGAEVITALFFGAAPIALGVLFKHVLRGRYHVPVYFIAPAAIGLFLLFMYPLVYEFYLSFTDLSLKTFSQWINTRSVPFVGIDHYIDVFKDRATGQSFFIVLGRTILWTLINVFFHVTVGLSIALILNQKGLKGVGAYRALISIPWFIPQIIAVLVWKTEFNESVGFINQFISVTNQLLSFEWGGEIIAPLTYLGFKPYSWFLDPWSLFAAACIVNIWLGIPFMMVNALGALQSISSSFYEAASIDGASKWQKFRHITLPLLKPVMVPATMLGGIWTFNNLNVIFLMTDGGRYEGADILVTDLYKQSFTYYKYSFAAAYSFVIFVVLCIMTLAQLRISKMSQSSVN